MRNVLLVSSNLMVPILKGVSFSDFVFSLVFFLLPHSHQMDSDEKKGGSLRGK